MDLRSGQPFWLVKNGIIATYPALDADLSCAVAVIGGGIIGALITYILVKEGIDVIVLDKRDIAWGSTSASTAMLQLGPAPLAKPKMVFPISVKRQRWKMPISRLAMGAMESPIA